MSNKTVETSSGEDSMALRQKRKLKHDLVLQSLNELLRFNDSWKEEKTETFIVLFSSLKPPYGDSMTLRRKRKLKLIALSVKYRSIWKRFNDSWKEEKTETSSL